MALKGKNSISKRIGRGISHPVLSVRRARTAKALRLGKQIRQIDVEIVDNQVKIRGLNRQNNLIMNNLKSRGGTRERLTFDELRQVDANKALIDIHEDGIVERGHQRIPLNAKLARLKKKPMAEIE